MGNDNLDDEGQKVSLSDKKQKQMEQLRTRRSVLIDQIRRCSDFVLRVEKNPDLTSVPEIKLRHEALMDSFTNFQKVQLKIEEGDPTEIKTATRSENEESYYSTSSSLQVMLNKLESPALDSSSSLNITQNRFDPVRLPKIELPIFTGDITTWMSWFETFSSLVHNNPHLNNLSKFHHLVSKLGEAARSSIDGLKIVEENYEEALQRLKERFENKRVIAQEHLHRIFNLPRVTKPSAEELRNLMDKNNNHLTCLRNMKRPVDQWDDLIVYLLSSKLDSLTANRWNEESPVDRLPTLVEFNAFIKKRCQIIEGNILNHSLSNTSSLKHNINSKGIPINQRSVQKSLITTTESKIKCSFCLKAGHFIYKCFKFLDLSLSERHEQIKELHLCENCLKTNQHAISDCGASGCHICGQRHHTLLHYDSALSSNPVILDPPTSHLDSNATIFDPSSSSADFKNTLTSSSLAYEQGSNSNTLLATALINVYDGINKIVPCRVLLDSGSQLNIINENFARLLGLKMLKTNQLISGIAQSLSSSQFKSSITFTSRSSEFKTTVEVIVLKRLTNNIPEHNIDISNWNIPTNITLSDPLFHVSKKIDLVLGAEVFFDLMSIGQIKLGSNLPILQKTTLGWVVSGPYQHSQDKILYRQVTFFSTQFQGDLTLHEELKKFWEIENGNDTIYMEHKFKGSELECEKHFETNFCRLDDGRYQVRLPFKSSCLKLGNSFSQALNRFKYLERRFHKNDELRKEYSAVINEFIALNHMEVAPKIDISKPHFFLPHHCVLKPSSSTTKMRVVFDGSAKTTTGISLNDTLLTGPVIQNDLFSIALRFRIFAFVFTADISKMYRQIVLHPADRCFHLILWRENETDEVKTFQLKTVTYGTAPASYLATKTLQQLSIDEGHHFPNAAKAVNTDFYVDDLLTGAATLQEALSLKSELIELLDRGGFKLRKWCSNDNRILETVNEVDREPFFRISDSNAIKTLGTFWDPASDKLLYDCPENKHNSITKRTVLSEIAKLFDPLGLINPIIVLAKVFMQQLWRHGLDWDESLPMEYHSRWLRFREELEHVGKFQFDRRVFYGTKNIQLHAFADSSEYAYGACLYVRCIKENGEISVNLLCSKSRVAPVKKVSIPRLELCAAVLMVRLVDKIQHICKGEFSEIFYWTDSSIVLSWLSEESSNFETFVANRVATIQNLTRVDQWHHVRSKLNPADIISRGAYPLELLKTDLWFYGPDYLKLEADKWPVLTINNKNAIEPLLERKTQKIILLGLKSESFWKTIKFHNDYLKPLRVVAYLLRYKNNCLAVKREYMEPMYGEITPSELHRSLTCIIRTIQQERFPLELELMRNKRPIPGRSHLASLRPFIDGDNLLRVGGRISNADLDYDARFPILIPKDHAFTEAMVRFYHEKFSHVGPQTLLSLIREKFWPIHGKIICKKVCRRCITCFRAQPVSKYYTMGDLPRARVQQCRPFLVVGVDLCGPFNIHFKRRGTCPVKGYVAVFVCFSTRAVHLEVVEDLSTLAFLAALKRFIGRRGYPSTIYSDNATNFIGSRNELSAVYKMLQTPETQNEITRACATDNITWKTIPPRSPHFGGLWEAAVKSAKFHMKRILHDASLTFQELNTIIIQIESVLNSRPLTPLSDNPSDLYALTPGHFIIGCPLTCLPEPDITEVKSINSLSRYQLLQWYFQMFWKRWSTEYLQSLQQRTKWKTSQNNLKIGDVVLIVDENSPPLKWKLGRIVDTQPGKDDIVRAATIKTATGIIQRSSVKLRRLPIIDFEESSILPQGGVDVK